MTDLRRHIQDAALRAVRFMPGISGGELMHQIRQEVECSTDFVRAVLQKMIESESVKRVGRRPHYCFYLPDVDLSASFSGRKEKPTEKIARPKFSSGIAAMVWEMTR